MPVPSPGPLPVWTRKAGPLLITLPCLLALNDTSLDNSRRPKWGIYSSPVGWPALLSAWVSSRVMKRTFRQMCAGPLSAALLQLCPGPSRPLRSLGFGGGRWLKQRGMSLLYVYLFSNLWKVKKMWRQILCDPPLYVVPRVVMEMKSGMLGAGGWRS